MPKIAVHEKDSGKKTSSAYKQLESLKFTFKNLKRSSDRKEEESVLKKFESKEEEIKKIINKFNAKMETGDIRVKASEINNSLKEIENKIFFISRIFEENNLNQIRNYLDHIPLEEYKQFSLNLEKNKILNESLKERKENHKEQKDGFDINHIDMTFDQKKLIIEFLKKYRNIFLLKSDYNNLNKNDKENLIKYLNKLISLGNKENNVSQIDFDKLDQQSKKQNLNSAEDLKRLKFINDFVDSNIISGGEHNRNIKHASSLNNINYNNNFQYNQPKNFPSDVNIIQANNSYNNPSTYNTVQHNKNSNFDFFGNVVPNNNVSHPQQPNKNINNPFITNPKDHNNDKHYFDDFSLLRDNSSESNNNFQALYENYPKSNENFDKSKKLARIILINEFKVAINRSDLSFDLAENFFFGTDDLKFAVQNYYQNKYEEENLKMNFKFPGGKDYAITKNFTDSPFSIFDDITNIIFKEKKEYIEFKLIQDGGRGVIDIDCHVNFLGGLNIEKNKIINVKYDLN